MTQLIDKRQQAGKKSTVNRQRFLRRYKNQLKQAVSQAIGKRKITEIEQGERVVIPAKDIAEPRIQHGKGGRTEHTLPGNDRFVTGDRIPHPQSSSQEGGTGDQASSTGSGEDDFIFQLSREEFLDLYFDDMALPRLVRKELAQVRSPEMARAGFTVSGTPTNINVHRSMRQATGRRVALASPYKKRLQQAEDELNQLQQQSPVPEADVLRLQQNIEHLLRKLHTIPFIDPLDLRYNHRVQLIKPTTQAVMFCIMDVSGSMDEQKKELAKRFFILLYLFLTRHYDKIELVFIRHHTSAKEVTEDEFFYSRETGGTVVSSALELLKEIIDSRYSPAAWNLYVAQASDGDNWNADSPYCQEMLQTHLMPLIQYFAYVEIMPRGHQSLWDAYLQIQQQYPHFAMETIHQLTDIYPVFRELFKRKTG